MNAIKQLVTFYVTRVGEAHTFSGTTKDGESFEVTKYPLTLTPSIESGFDRDCQFSMWVSSSEVARKAAALCEHQTDRLALVNDVRSFRTGKRKTSTWTVKDTGEQASRDQLTVYLDGDEAPSWVRVAFPRAKDAGNIASVDVSDIKVEPKVVVETSDAPF
jgi:hypothetical protein